MLTSHGALHMDHFLKKALLTPPKSPLSKEQSYTYYKDNIGEIRARQVNIDYSEDTQGLSIKVITLKGDVRLKNYLPYEGENSTSQIAIADELVYYPKEGIAILSAKKPNNVLYLDQGNDIQISAPKIELQRLAQNTSPLIKASGHVRARLNPNEIKEVEEKLL